MSENCKYCGAVKISHIEALGLSYDLFDCSSESHSDGALWQSANCRKSQEKLVTSPDEYRTAVLIRILFSTVESIDDRVIEVLRRCGVSVDDAVRVITEVWGGDNGH